MTEENRFAVARSCTYLDKRRRERCTECGNQITLCTCENPDDRAINRNESDHGKILSMIWTEIWQRKPSDNLYEELVHRVGELGQKLVEHKNNRSPAPDVILQEFVRIGALLVEFAANGTDEYSYPST